MILVDTSVWVDHLRHAVPGLAELLDRGQVLMHPFVIGEIACGGVTDRSETLELLKNLPMGDVAEADELLAFIKRHGLHGQGIGLVDAHLLASTALAAGARLWTRDKRLDAAAERIGCRHRGLGAH